jgi:predicted nucleic acid-binding protein
VRFFLDTNIIVYALDGTDPAKSPKAKALVREALVEQAGVISYQVVQECLHLILRKFRRKVHDVDAHSYLARVLMPLCNVYPTGGLYAEAILIASQTGWTFYDSLIVSAAIEADCDRLLTEDLQDGRVIRGVKIQNPFK